MPTEINQESMEGVCISEEVQMEKIESNLSVEEENHHEDKDDNILDRGLENSSPCSVSEMDVSPISCVIIPKVTESSSQLDSQQLNTEKGNPPESNSLRNVKEMLTRKGNEKGGPEESLRNDCSQFGEKLTLASDTCDDDLALDASEIVEEISSAEILEACLSEINFDVSSRDPCIHEEHSVKRDHSGFASDVPGVLTPRVLPGVRNSSTEFSPPILEDCEMGSLPSPDTEAALLLSPDAGKDGSVPQLNVNESKSLQAALSPIAEQCAESVSALSTGAHEDNTCLPNHSVHVLGIERIYRTSVSESVGDSNTFEETSGFDETECSAQAKSFEGESVPFSCHLPINSFLDQGKNPAKKDFAACIALEPCFSDQSLEKDQSPETGNGNVACVLEYHEVLCSSEKSSCDFSGRVCKTSECAEVQHETDGMNVFSSSTLSSINVSSTLVAHSGVVQMHKTVAVNSKTFNSNYLHHSEDMDENNNTDLVLTCLQKQGSSTVDTFSVRSMSSVMEEVPGLIQELACDSEFSIPQRNPEVSVGSLIREAMMVLGNYEDFNTVSMPESTGTFLQYAENQCTCIELQKFEADNINSTYSGPGKDEWNFQLSEETVLELTDDSVYEIAEQLMIAVENEPLLSDNQDIETPIKDLKREVIKAESEVATGAPQLSLRDGDQIAARKRFTKTRKRSAYSSKDREKKKSSEGHTSVAMLYRNRKSTWKRPADPLKNKSDNDTSGTCVKDVVTSTAQLECTPSPDRVNAVTDAGVACQENEKETPKLMKRRSAVLIDHTNSGSRVLPTPCKRKPENSLVPVEVAFPTFSSLIKKSRLQQTYTDEQTNASMNTKSYKEAWNIIITQAMMCKIHQ